MTPMSDVMVLLLTFFMLTATFVKEEPIKVNAPGSVSEIKIPESNLLTIFVEKNGKVFMTMDSPESAAYSRPLYFLLISVLIFCMSVAANGREYGFFAS